MGESTRKKAIGIVTAAGLVIGILMGIVAGTLLRSLPRVEALEYYRPDVVTQILDSSNHTIGEFFTERRIVLKRREIPDSVVHAILAAEDAEFFSHSGFDFPGILRAIIKNALQFKKSQGASTLTQQMARMLFLTNEKTYRRKLKEAILTIEIERRYSKDEILTLYLNQSYFGHGAYGIESAAHTFFNKSSALLEKCEAATLVCLLKNPALFSPFNHPDRALSSRNHVLNRMREKGFLTETELTEFSSRPLGVVTNRDRSRIGPYYVEEVRKIAVETQGNEKVLTGGLIIKTCMDLEHQIAAESAVSKGYSRFKTQHLDGADIQIALVSIKPGSGDVTSLVGGVDFSLSQFNRAMQAHRQPGSTIKPFIYLTALMKGFKPTDFIDDTAFEYIDPDSKQAWHPQNYDRVFHGPMTLRKALEQSNNIVAIKLLQQVGIDDMIRVAQQAGISTELPRFLSVGLGSGEVTLLDLTNSYATIAADGMYAKPRLVCEIRDHKSTILDKVLPHIEEKFSAKYCAVLTHLLCGVVQNGSGWRLKSLNRPIAAKTGTTSDYSDAWLIAYTPTIAAGVWVGYDIKKSLGRGETGSSVAGPILVEFLDQIYAGIEPENFILPDGVREEIVCRDSGQLAGPNCTNLYKELFIASQLPLTRCKLH